MNVDIEPLVAVEDLLIMKSALVHQPRLLSSHRRSENISGIASRKRAEGFLCDLYLKNDRLQGE